MWTTAGLVRSLLCALWKKTWSAGIFYYQPNSVFKPRGGDCGPLLTVWQRYENRTLRAVGAASERFNEDALRIMRASVFRLWFRLWFGRVDLSGYGSLRQSFWEDIGMDFHRSLDKLPWWHLSAWKGLGSLDNAATTFFPDMKHSAEALQELLDGLKKIFSFLVLSRLGLRFCWLWQ